MTNFESLIAAGALGFLCGASGYLAGIMHERARAIERMVDEWREYSDSFFARVMRANHDPAK